jgi:hypothetical protein
VKKILIALLVAGLSFVAIAALDTSTLQNGVAFVPQSINSGAAAVSGVAFDKMSYSGVANIIVVIGANTGATVNAQLQTAPASTGTFANVTGASVSVTGTNGAVGEIAYDLTGGSRYFRLVVTNVAAGATAIVGATINAH